ncbi:TetR/AcrR family transcriptional regulator [Microlunatus sp. GCM10028923]|uniref:TetR/AcrR family transcriptional regulator n=1 Tax=Microlunatus sp. GCM10028923 TaxID=3273400 RepID=UPI00360A641C
MVNEAAADRSGTRRRGAALVQAIHDATLAELSGTGYARLSMEAVAARAGTGKAALYRRWPTKQDLVIDALNATLPDLTRPIETAGTLRDSLLTCLRGMRDVLAGRTGFPDVTVLVELMREPGVAQAYREKLITARMAILRSVLERAVERGELRADKITPLVVRTGPALILQGLLMTGTPPPDAELRRIVDEILLPLLGAG